MITTNKNLKEPKQRDRKQLEKRSSVFANPTEPNSALCPKPARPHPRPQMSLIRIQKN
jgi:hypothetical protein